MSMDSVQKIISQKNEIRQCLLDWFADAQRDLPWRQTYDPYQVWISEIMGQQTQMDRVVEYFNRWVALFPDVTSVANAREREILKSWEGLGYYSRARNIHQTAKIIVNEFNGILPENTKDLLRLPGIGPYTAAAIVSIAYNQPVPLLDANVERLFARLLDLSTPVKQTPGCHHLQTLAQELLPLNQARQFNQALMEFGALVCKPKKPGCLKCPLADYCVSLPRGTVKHRPVKAKKKVTVELEMVSALIMNKGKVFIQQRAPGDVWGGLWEFPGGKVTQGKTAMGSVSRVVEEETALRISRLRHYATVVHRYTKYRVTLHGIVCRLDDVTVKPVLHAATRFRWVTLSEISDYPFSAGQRQFCERLCRSGK